MKWSNFSFLVVVHLQEDSVFIFKLFTFMFQLLIILLFVFLLTWFFIIIITWVALYDLWEHIYICIYMYVTVNTSKLMLTCVSRVWSTWPHYNNPSFIFLCSWLSVIKYKYHTIFTRLQLVTSDSKVTCVHTFAEISQGLASYLTNACTKM